MKKGLLYLAVLLAILASFFNISPEVIAQESQAPHEPSKAYQRLIPINTGSETGLKAFPPKLEVGDAGKDNWLASSHPRKDLPIGEYTYDAVGDPIAVNPYAGAIYISADTGDLIISSGTLSDKCKYDIEVSNYSIYGGNLTWNEERQKYIVTSLRAKFRDYVYGSGSDLYQLEDTPQRNDARDLPIQAIRVYAYVLSEANATKPEASTKISINSKKYSGTKVIPTWTEQRIVTIYTTNPATGVAWTWEELDNLEAGITLKEAICTYVYVEVELEVHSQTFFPITPVDVSPGVTGSYQSVNVSGSIASGATGVILHFVNESGTYTPVLGVRKNGSTDAYEDLQNNNQHYWGMIGVDADRIFECYLGSSDYQVWLVGYTMSGVTLLTNSVLYDPGSYGSWVQMDASSDAPNAIGLIFECYSAGAGDDINQRKNGSTDNRLGGNYRKTWFSVIGCDGSQLFDNYWELNTSWSRLVGYVTAGATFNTNATDISLGSTGSWIDLAAVPAGSSMSFIEVWGVTDDYGLRENGSAENVVQRARTHVYGILECDASGIVEGQIENTAVDFFQIGYAEGAGAVSAPTVTSDNSSSVEETTVTFSGNITVTGGENCTDRFFRYGTPSGNYTANVSESGNFGTGIFSLGETGLSPGTTYYWTAGANNTAGFGYGGELYFTTKPQAPTSLTDPSRLSTQITLTWTLGAGSENTTIRYRDDGSYPTNYADGTLGYSGTAATCNITGLSPSIRYHIGAWAVNTDNVTLYSDASDQLIAWTLPGDASSANTSNPTYFTLDLDWTKGASSNRTHWRWNTSSYPADISAGTQAYFGTANSTTVESLPVGTLIYFNGWAYSDNSTYYSSGNVTATGTTTSAAAPTVTTANATNILSTSATLNGNITAINGQNASSRGFEWGLISANYTDNQTSAGSFGTGAFTEDIAGLSANTTYYSRAMALNDGGWGYGDEISFATSVTPPEEEVPPWPPAPPPEIPRFPPEGERLSLMMSGCVVLFFSGVSFWRRNALLFMLAAGASLMVGLHWFEVYNTNTGLTISLMLIIYALVCLGFAFGCIFWRDRLREEE